MNPLGSNNLATFASIGRGLTQLAAAVRDLFQGAYTTVARWLGGAPAQAGAAAQIGTRQGVEVTAQPDPRRADGLAQKDFVIPGTEASTASSQANATFDAGPVTWRADTEAAGGAAASDAERLHGSPDALGPLAQATVDAVQQWCGMAKPIPGANAGNNLFRSKDSPGTAITQAMTPFKDAILAKAGTILGDVAALRAQSPARSDDDLLLEVASKHLVGDGSTNPLRDLVPAEQQALLRSVRGIVAAWDPDHGSAGKVFSSSLFLRCASPAVVEAATTKIGSDRVLLMKLSKLLTTLANHSEALAATKGAQQATTDLYRANLLQTSQAFQARIRDLEQG